MNYGRGKKKIFIISLFLSHRMKQIMLFALLGLTTVTLGVRALPNEKQGTANRLRDSNLSHLVDQYRTNNS